MSTEIAASAETVWRTLIDLERYPEWNPFIRHARGALDVGDEVHVRVRPPLGIPLRFTAKILERAENRELRWWGKFGAPWLASGEHAFVIEPIDERHVRFVQREELAGLVPRLLRRLFEPQVRQGFDAMNRALAARAESAEQAAHAVPASPA